MRVRVLSSFRIRLIASVLAIEVTMLGIMVWNTVDSIYRTHTDRLYDTAQSLVRQFADIAGSDLIELDYASLEEYASHVLEHPEVAYVVVQDFAGRAVAAMGPAVPAELPLPEAHPTAVTDGVYDVRADIRLAGRPQGQVQIGFSLAMMNADIRLARNRALVIAAAEVLLSAVATILLGMYLTRHLRALAEAAERVGRGHYDRPVPLRADDEIGRTARAFNAMMEEIGERTRGLEESRRHIRMLMDSTAEAIVGLDLDHRCIFVNRACVRMLGFDAEAELLGRDFHEIVHGEHGGEEERDPGDCRLRPVPGEGGDAAVYIHDEVFRRADGSTISVDAWTHPILEDGVHRGYMVTFIDVSERRAAQQALERSQAEFEAMFQAIADAVLFTDPEHRVKLANPAVQTLLGHAPEALRGCEVDVLLAGGQRSDALARSPGTAGGGAEVLCRRRDGSVFWAEVIDSPVTDRGGDVIGHIFLIRDISDRKRAEQELLDHRDRLEDLVRARTVELEAINNELEAFAYSVSHDLRAPLRHIDGYSLALLEDYGTELDAEGRRYLERLRRGAQHMGELIDDLLALSQVTRAELRKERVDLSAMAREICAELQRSESGRQVEIHIAPGLEAVVDPRLLRLALTNLLANAWKFSSGVERAVIRFDARVLDGETVYRIADNGAGFDMRYAAKLFEPFERLHADEEFRGTGIGLATVRRIVERHGGRIWAEGRPGAGASFFFTLEARSQRSTPGPAACDAGGRGDSAGAHPAP